LKELQENSIVKDILLRALNDFDKSSKPARLGVIHTCKSSRINRLKLEIERVQASNQVVMDTDVISDGVMQRKTRIAYLNELKCELSLLLKDTEIVEEVQKEDDSIQGYPTNANKETKENEERTENEEKRQIIMNDRESQFLFRQEILNLQIQQYREKCSGNVQRKYFLISQMRSVQPRIHSLESELERLSSSTLSHIASPVLHGDSDQKFERSQLINSLEHELTKSYNCISSWKSEIISSDRESKEFQSLILIKEERLDERKSALMRFKQEREEKLNRHQQKEWTSIAGILRTYLLGWSLYSRRIGSAIVKLKNFEEKHIVTKVFLHWKESQFFRSQTHGIDTQKKNRQFSSAGEAKLFDAENARRENYESIGALIKSVTDNSMIDSLERLDAGTFTPQNQFVGHTKIMLMKGYIHANSNNFEEALQCFRAAIGSFEKQNHSKLSSNSYSQLHSYLEGLITQMLMKLGLWNKAIFHLEDLLFQAKSDNSTINIFSTNVLLGECYSEVGDLSLAKTYFVAAFANKEMKSKKLELRAHHGLQMCYMQLGDKDRSIESKKKCHHLKADINDEITLALGKAKVMEDKLIGVNAKVGIVTQLQRATSKYMFTKRTIETMKKELKQNKKELGIIKEEAKTVQISLYRIREELYKTEQSGEEKVTSSLVHENSQVIEVGELTTMLKNSEQEKVSRFLEYQKRVKDLELEIKNKHDDLSILKSDLELEQCGLMQRILRSRQIRCMCFNSAYTRGNDIMGFNKEMRHLIALSIESDIYVHDLKSGELVEVFNDHLNHNQREKPDAAKSSVTALSFYKSKVFAGSVDKAIRCWDIRTRNVAYTIWGHQSAVTCIQAVDQFLLSGSADTNVILWNSDTGEKLQILQGHTRGILSLYFSQDICLTGDADGEIFVWNLSSFKYHSRLILNPRHKITVVKGGKLEIVCGNETGTISVWWIQSEELLGECKAHNGPVTDVAFDSTKLVSCGMDESIKVIDLMMLQVIQTIRCHGSQLLSIVFDERNLLTMSKDGNIRQWLWGDGNRESHDNIHVFASGENLQEICNKYEVKMSALIKWNSNINLKKMLPGMAIVVGQGHLDKGSKRIKGNASKSSLMDGSRAFSTSRNEVENHDLFPINENIHDEASSLVSRLGKSLDLKMQT
jgi:WD40 repeat protein